MSTNSKEYSQTNNVQVRHRMMRSIEAEKTKPIFAFRDEPVENSSDEENKITLNDINQLKIRVKSIGITFDEMNAIQVNDVRLGLNSNVFSFF